MKKKLLTLFALALLTVNGYSQAEAFDAPNMYQCGIEVFDFTAQNSYVLGNQDPDNFTVEYFISEADATNNTNAIEDPTFYITLEGEIQEIFARVTNTTDDSYDITSFMIGYGSTWVPEMNDVTQCGEYILQTLVQGNYYTGPGGTGTMLMPGDAITASQTIYIYYQAIPVDASCMGESSFEVTIMTLLDVSYTPEPLVVCDENLDGSAVFDLALIYEQILMALGSPSYVITIHETEADAMMATNALSNPEWYSYTNITPYEQILYVRIQDAEGGCFDILEAPIVASPCVESTLSGTVMFDAEGDGCDANDLPAAGLTVISNTDGYVNYSAVNLNGEYSFSYVPAGETTVTVAPDAYVPFTASPSEYNITTPVVETDLNFCLEAEDVNDVLVWIMPTSAAMPGFEASYTLIYANYGTLPSSGVISLTFDDASITYNTSVPAMQQNGNTLSFSYNDLQPFATSYAYITFTIMQPPTVNMGDILEFEAIIDAETDDNFSNNTYALSQLVTNSYDPNDITVREGASITPEQAEGYLHYTVRFQNEGTANAQTVRIETQLDANLDWDTFMPMNASHTYEIIRDEQGAVEFIFNNIDLPFTDADEAGSQGYIMYKIKPVSTIELGNSMSATAGIYFDFNEAVITNTAVTTVEEATAGGEEINDNTFVIYPNPASDNITLRMQNITNTGKVTITDVLGKTVLTSTISGNELNLNVTTLDSGMYFLTLETQGKSITKKVMIK
ncbi:T9SS type A sorting domain-containing protein [Flavobacterium sp. LaA7.5]|nr:T9SS type A sorting domain-containing protein [Flavobacterium salilacus subsp. altitudinum]